MTAHEASFEPADVNSSIGTTRLPTLRRAATTAGRGHEGISKGARCRFTSWGEQQLCPLDGTGWKPFWPASARSTPHRQPRPAASVPQRPRLITTLDGSLGSALLWRPGAQPPDCRARSAGA